MATRGKGTRKRGATRKPTKSPKRKKSATPKKQAGARAPIRMHDAARQSVRDFSAHDVNSVADWDDIPDWVTDELWHHYTFEFPGEGFAPDDVPALAEIARARLYKYGYRGLTSVRVNSGIGTRDKISGEFQKSLTYTRNFNAAFSQIGARLKQLKNHGSLTNLITGIEIFVRVPAWMARQQGYSTRKRVPKKYEQKKLTPQSQKPPGVRRARKK